MRSMPAFSVWVEPDTSAGADQLHGDDARRLVDVDQFDVAAVGLESRPDDLDAGFYLGTGA